MKDLIFRPSVSNYPGSNMQYFPQCTQPMHPTSYIQPVNIAHVSQKVNTEPAKCDSQVSKPPGLCVPQTDLLPPSAVAKSTSTRENASDISREIAVVTPEKPSSHQGLSYQVTSKALERDKNDSHTITQKEDAIVADERPSLQPVSPSLMEFERKVLIKRLVT